MLPTEIIRYIFLFQEKWKYLSNIQKIVYLKKLTDMTKIKYSGITLAYCTVYLKIKKTNKYYLIVYNEYVIFQQSVTGWPKKFFVKLGIAGLDKKNNYCIELYGSSNKQTWEKFNINKKYYYSEYFLASIFISTCIIILFIVFSIYIDFIKWFKISNGNSIYFNGSIYMLCFYYIKCSVFGSFIGYFIGILVEVIRIIQHSSNVDLYSFILNVLYLFFFGVFIATFFKFLLYKDLF